MTVDYAVELRTGDLRIRFRDRPLAMSNLLARLEGVAVLLELASLVEYSGQFGLSDFDLRGASGFRTEVRDRTDVRTISYASPLEIVLTIGAVVGVGTGVANRLVDTFNRFQAARIKKAEADTQVVALQVLRERLVDPLSTVRFSDFGVQFRGVPYPAQEIARETLEEIDEIDATS